MQIRAATRVNQEMLHFYWSMGKDIIELHAESKWGSKFYNNLSQDLKNIMPEIKSFSPTNLKYMKYFYELYSKIDSSDIDKPNHKISPQLVDQLCTVLWGIIEALLINIKGTQTKLFSM